MGESEAVISRVEKKQLGNMVAAEPNRLQIDVCRFQKLMRKWAVIMLLLFSFGPDVESCCVVLVRRGKKGSFCDAPGRSHARLSERRAAHGVALGHTSLAQSCLLHKGRESGLCTCD